MPWPPVTFDKHIDAGFGLYPTKRQNILISGSYFERVHIGPKRGWFFRKNGHIVNNKIPFAGMPANFPTQGFSGAYYNKASNTIHFFSGNEFIVYSLSTNSVISGPKKISDAYKGL